MLRLRRPMRRTGMDIERASTEPSVENKIWIITTKHGSYVKARILRHHHYVML